jgi:general stress protein 26
VTVKEEIRKLRNESDIAYIGSVNEDGFPQIKAMLVPEHESLKTQYFSTNLSSKRAGQFQKNPKASVYYTDNTKNLYKVALFTGTMEVCVDHDTKAFLWNDGDEIYYPAGVDDPDYCVFKFTAETVNFYHALGNRTLSVDEIE